MLGGRISNQDEDEVEDELDALEAEVVVLLGRREAYRLILAQVNQVQLPEAPTSQVTGEYDSKHRTQEASQNKARAKAREKGSAQAAEPLAA